MTGYEIAIPLIALAFGAAAAVYVKIMARNLDAELARERVKRPE